MNREQIQVSAVVNAPLERVWDAFTTPADIMTWNHASDDWHCPAATNDLRVGGTFTSQMAARDGSVSFEFSGEYTQVTPHQSYTYRMPDGRMAEVTFWRVSENQTLVAERFDPEQTHPAEMQQAGWQAILNNFKAHAESKSAPTMTDSGS